MRKFIIMLLIMVILAMAGTAIAGCNDIYGCNTDGCDIMEGKRTKTSDNTTYVTIRVTNEVNGKPVKLPVVRLGKPYATKSNGTPCWMCKEGSPAWSWKKAGRWAYEKRPTNGIVRYKAKQFGGDRVSQSDPHKICIWIYKPGCDYKIKGIVTVHMGYNNVYNVYLDCPLRIKVETN